MPWYNVVLAHALGSVFYGTICIFLIPSPVRDISDSNWFVAGVLLISGMVFVIAQVSMTIGMQKEKSAMASAMRTSDIMFGFLFQVCFTNDEVTGLSLGGATLILAGIFIIAFKKSFDGSASIDVVKQSNGETAVYDKLEDQDIDDNSRAAIDEDNIVLDFKSAERSSDLVAKL